MEQSVPLSGTTVNENAVITCFVLQAN